MNHESSVAAEMLEIVMANALFALFAEPAARSVHVKCDHDSAPRLPAKLSEKVTVDAPLTCSSKRRIGYVWEVPKLVRYCPTK